MMERGVYLIPIVSDGEKEVVTGARVKFDDLLNDIIEAVIDCILSVAISSTKKE